MRPEEGIRVPGTGGAHSCVPLHSRCSEPNAGPLQEPQVLLTIQPLQPPPPDLFLVHIPYLYPCMNVSFVSALSPEI